MIAVIAAKLAAITAARAPLPARGWAAASKIPCGCGVRRSCAVWMRLVKDQALLRGPFLADSATPQSRHKRLHPALHGYTRLPAGWLRPPCRSAYYRYHGRAMGTQIFVAGDCHGRFGHVIEACAAYRPEVLILLGDMESPSPLDQALAPILGCTNVYWIIGNHDTDSECSYDHLFGSALADRHLHGGVVEVGGTRIAGLGGVFREKVWAPPAAPLFQSPEDFVRRCGRGNRWRDGLPLKHRSTIFPSDYRRLLRERADVLVTHEAPGCHRNGFQALDEVANGLRVRLVLHGHHHENYQAKIAGGVRVIGVGLRAIVDLDGRVIVPGEPA